MTTESRLHHPDYFPLWRESQDTLIRTRLGGFYYLLAWLLTWGFSSTPLAILPLGIGATLFFTLMLIARRSHRLGAQETTADLQRWIDRHWGLILLTALGWGLAHAWALYRPEFAPSRLIATLSTIAFSTAMAFSFSMRKLRCTTAILLLYVPGLLVLALDHQQQQAELVTLALYFSYLLLALNRSHQEYHTTIALEQELVEQRERYDQLSRTDSLTQLGNRHQFNNLFPTLVAVARRQHTPLSLVLIDIDFFKRINDEFGHSSGDLCLQAFAERMREVFRRDSDALLRLGGEEFGVLMPDTLPNQARVLAERFRSELLASGFSLNERNLPLTASLGVGSFDPQRDDSPEAFFKRVDNALYQAKAEGRDRIVLADFA
ncbi:diguanylate cyclase [Pseudomonas sp. UL073]|uniref:diguanylate cyclase n=1 Tax=Zestomonas insulae TaxID=2809017 RepID=A0ABS2IG95_9GAMM|nr:diguanylate cyclase [Pseudomonas insulae]MBM7061349.1 diguanylate cyclase [Pseudomonas insulae]